MEHKRDFMVRTDGGTLYIVATPIGNAGDITERAKQVLASVDLIAAEDTRASGLLLKSLNISNKLVSNYKFNEQHRVEYILGELERGASVAIISDAGSPCISDPGGVVVRAAAGRGFRVAAVCGASAVTAALSVCGLEYDAFTFFGFLPKTAKAIEKLLAAYTGGAGWKPTQSLALVFFESPKRIKKSMEVFAAVMPGASICLCNDLTKRYERIYRGTPCEVLDALLANPSAEKGEYTLVCLPAGKKDVSGEEYASGKETASGIGSASGIEDIYDEPDASAEPDVTAGATGAGMVLPDLSPEAAVTDCIVKRGCTPKDAIEYLSGDNGGVRYKKKELYAAVHNLKKLFYG